MDPLTDWLMSLQYVWLFVTPWTVAHQTPLYMGFSRQEHWSELPCPPAGDFPNPEIEPASLMSPALVGKFLTTSITWEAFTCAVVFPKIYNLSPNRRKHKTNSYLGNIYSITDQHFSRSLETREVWETASGQRKQRSYMTTKCSVLFFLNLFI